MASPAHATSHTVDAQDKPSKTGQNILIHGVPGSGKSTMAFTLLNFFLRAGCPCNICDVWQGNDLWQLKTTKMDGVHIFVLDYTLDPRVKSQIADVFASIIELSTQIEYPDPKVLEMAQQKV